MYGEFSEKCKIDTKDSNGLFDLNLCKVGFFQGSMKKSKVENYEP